MDDKINQVLASEMWQRNALLDFVAAWYVTFEENVPEAALCKLGFIPEGKAISILRDLEAKGWYIPLVRMK